MSDQLLSFCRALIAIVLLGGASVVTAQTYTFSTLYSFKNNTTDPANPMSFPTVDSSGNIYGTSFSGGSDRTDCSGGCGSVFKLTPSGSLSVLHSFNAGPDYGGTTTNVARDKAGNLYGTSGSTAGIAFKITPSGDETIIHSFPLGSSNGFSPNNVILDSAGNLYGTTLNGGPAGFGLVFKIDASDNYSVLYSFCPSSGCSDGEFPFGRLVRDSAGNLYGAALSGGISTDCAGGCGVVYKLTPGGVQTVLHAFDGTDGYQPLSGLTQDKKGNLYGVDNFGGEGTFGTSNGTLFKQPESGGALTILYNFCARSRCADGKNPIGPVQIDSVGNIYGVAQGSAGNMGSVVWEFTAAGKEVVLHTFPKNVVCDGGLAIDSSGNLYGFTSNGGTDSLGSVYKLTLAH